ncbi:MAG: MATE family efflux transporter, partial [Anaerovoracaceae bacterium]
SLKRQMFVFSLPYFLSYFLQMLYGLADLFITGQYNGADVITAVSVGSQVMHMVTVVIVGLTMGTTVVLGRAIGAGDREKAAKVVGNTFTFFIIFSFVLTFVMLALRDVFIRLLAVPAESVADTRTYLLICSLGIPFITLYNVISAIFRGSGDSKTPMYFIAIACVVNIVLDYVFIGPMHMRAAGAAYGTVIAQAVSVVVSLIVIVKRKVWGKLTKSSFKIEKSVIRNMMSVGVPIAAQDGLIQVSFLVITSLADSYGVEVAAAVGIVEKIITFLFLVPSTMLSTVSTISSHSIGAGKYSRALKVLKYGLITTVTIGIAFAAVFQVAASPVVGQFTDDKAVIELGTQYLKVYVFDCAAAGVHFCFSGFFCASEMAVVSFVYNILSVIIVRIPWTYYALKISSDNLTLMGMAPPMGSIFSDIICVTAFVIAWKKGRFKDVFESSQQKTQ